ncbi:Aim25p KNAG_0D01320 [Huiozyma naganishii CBS 8797]|uniref:Phospholipid scramblase n=1 Tax=Huiozyma naganishii (strain ATCC MYA-139 / BCRC 22969 / CBS 8797 / KCTC 17520 / NBRC 10181 / NCYC 3082 / Yp74L-3) TaxID=1071383 RepID=J7S5K0_HUIN7|nr:hypothetical protein KNAG_0D01320 [Kazachstania naganishii CBS 8797]CCK69884.1 hypothetical protein KNAG_0D01320 [Kazachstania naganishii CBS 8797]
MSGNALITKLRSIKAILSTPTLVIERQIEFGNLIFGFEQRNKYTINNPAGETLGYILERERSLSQVVLRQFTKLHRPFVVDVFDRDDNYLFKMQRNFSFINSKVHIWNETGQDVPSMPDDFLVGTSMQRWHLWRRKYDLFVNSNQGKSRELKQFGAIDAPFLSFDFPVLDEAGKVVASVDRNWVGLGRELFTDTGVYIIRFDSQRSFKGVYDQSMLSNEVLNLNERAVLLGNAISIDFDYFSRHSRDATNGGLFSLGGGNYE